MMIAEMDAAGVDKSAIVQASTAYGYDNSYVAEAIAAFPTRFTGVFSIDVLAADAVDKMKYWLDRGFAGMRLFTTGSTMPGQATWFDEPGTYPSWEYAGKAGIPVCMQVTPAALPADARADERFPQGQDSSSTIWPSPTSATVRPTPRRRRCSSWPRYKNLYLKVTPRNSMPERLGQGDARDLLPQAGRHVRRRPYRLGLELSRPTRGRCSMLLEKSKQSLASLTEQERAWILGRTAQNALSKAWRLSTSRRRTAQLSRTVCRPMPKRGCIP